MIFVEIKHLIFDYLSTFKKKLSNMNHYIKLSIFWNKYRIEYKEKLKKKRMIMEFKEGRAISFYII